MKTAVDVTSSARGVAFQVGTIQGHQIKDYPRGPPGQQVLDTRSAGIGAETLADLGFALVFR